MIDQNHIENLSSMLRKILLKELELGNEIVETSQGWPDKNTIIIFLKKPFIDEYSLDNTVYKNIDDPHYWKEEYFDQITKHIIACKF